MALVHRFRYKWVILLIVTLVLQSRCMFLGVRPEFLSALIFIYAMRKGDDLKAAGFGAFAGFLEDVLSGAWGPNMVSKTLVGFLSANILGGFFVWSPILGIVGIFVMTVIDSIIGILVAALKDQPVSVSTWIMYTIVIQALINAPFGYLAGSSEDTGRLRVSKKGSSHHQVQGGKT